MKGWYRFLPLLLVAGVFLAVSAARAQMARPETKEPQHVRVAIYRVAPGKHLEFLKWLAESDAIDKEAGVAVPQIYVHTNGDSWDYLQINPDVSKEQQARIDEVTRKHGRKTGFAAGLEFRTFVASHTDTMADGPLTAADLVVMAGK